MTKALAFILALVASFAIGGVSGRHDWLPWPQIHALKEKVAPTPPPESRYVVDKLDRLVADETKPAIACPAQTDRTAVLLVLGQSNAANHGGQRYRSQQGDRVVNFFDGRCFRAASPLLGATGTTGEYWTEVANLLIESGRFDQVVIAPLAINGSAVARWAPGGDINPLLIQLAAQIKQQGYRPTYVLWHQGEADYVLGTSEDAYKERFLSMVDTLRKGDVTAPVYISIASKCLEPSNGGFKTNSPDNSIVRAQMSLSQEGGTIRRGVNTDALLDGNDRYDDCHMGGSGLEKTAQAWGQILLQEAKVHRATAP